MSGPAPACSVVAPNWGLASNLVREILIIPWACRDTAPLFGEVSCFRGFPLQVRRGDSGRRQSRLVRDFASMYRRNCASMSDWTVVYYDVFRGKDEVRAPISPSKERALEEARTLMRRGHEVDRIEGHNGQVIVKEKIRQFAGG